MHRILLPVVALLLVPLTVLTVANAANPEDSLLAQSATADGCRVPTIPAGPTPCTIDDNAHYPWGAVVSPDGANVYAASFQGDSVLSYARAGDGSLTPLPGVAACTSNATAVSAYSGCSTPNAIGRQIDGLIGLTISPDGKTVYTMKLDSLNGQHAIGVFARDSVTGALTQLAGDAGCLTQLPASGCTDVRALGGLRGITVSPDGKNVYAASGGSNGVAFFDRNTTTGALTQRAGADGCLVAGGGDMCASGGFMNGAYGIEVSPDGEQVAVVSNGSDSLVLLTRETDTNDVDFGELAFNSCFDTSGTGTCALNEGLDGVQSVRYSSDGENLYTAAFPELSAFVGGRVGVFDRTPVTGVVTSPAGTGGCLSEDGSGGVGAGTAGKCQDVTRIPRAYELASSLDGRSVYVVGNGVGPTSGTLAVLQRAGDGSLSQATDTTACWDENNNGLSYGNDATCQRGRGLLFGTGVAVSADGKSVYTTSQAGISTFSRGAEGGVAPTPTPTPSPNPSPNPTTGPGPQQAPAAADLAGSPKSVKVSAKRKFAYPFSAAVGLQGTLVVKKGSKTLVAQGFTVPGGGAVKLTLKLTKSSYAKITKAKPMKVTVTVSLTNAAGTSTASKALKLKRK